MHRFGGGHVTKQKGNWHPMDDKLIKACQMFLLPASVLFAALGLAQSDGLKTGVSSIAFVISGAWVWRIWVWENLDWKDQYAALAFAGIFLVASFISLGVHGMAWLGW